MVKSSFKNRISKSMDEKSSPFVEDKNPTSNFNDPVSIEEHPSINSEVNKLTDDQNSIKKRKKIDKLEKKLTKKINSPKNEEIDFDQIKNEEEDASAPIKKKKLKKENVDEDRPKKKSKKNEGEDDVDEPKKKSKKKLKEEIPEIDNDEEEKPKIEPVVKEEWQPKRSNEWWIQYPDKEILEETQRRLREQDSRSLYFRFASKNINEDDLRTLSPDIQFVKWRRLAGCSGGWIYYENNEISKINLEKLNGKKINDVELSVRHCLYYEDEKPKPAIERDPMINTLKLDIAGLRSSTTQQDLEQAFPAASAYFRDPKTMLTNAYALFDKPEIARQAFLGGKDMIMNGDKLTVLYYRPTKHEKGKVQSLFSYQQQKSRRFRPPPKKQWRGYVGDY